MNPYPWLKTHLFYLIIIAIGLVAFRSWLAEHDHGLQMEQQMKISENTVKSLQAQIVSNDAAASATIQALQNKAATVKTPTQAIQAIPSVQIADLPLNPRPSPMDPNSVVVDAMPLFQTLEKAKEDAVKLQTCNTDLVAEKGIVAAKDDEIVALKKKPKFWARIKSHGRWAVIGMLAYEGARIYLTHKP